MTLLFKQYIEHYAEKEAQSLAINELFSMEYCDYSMAIPLCQELAQIPALLHSIEEAAIHASKKIALIMVFNHRENASIECKEENMQSIDLVVSKIHKPSSQRLKKLSLIYGPLSHRIFVILIDRCSEGLEFGSKDGVGLARKIGCDLASVLFSRNFIRESWIFNSDADAILAIDYFVMEKQSNQKLAALLYPFKHHANSELSSPQKQALTLYDRYLHYYVEGLKSAGSPYAFATLGSTIAVTAYAYVAVRGFPKRLAGEDFYFLNKIAKTAELKQKKTLPILLQGRLSNRVPFGTGPAIQDIAELLQRGDEYKVYHPKSFAILKFWIDSCAPYFSGKFDSWSKSAALLESQEFSYEDRQLCVKVCTRWIDLLGGFIFFENLVSRYRSTSKPIKHFHIWFDAFKTMKFIHFIRDHFLPPIDFTSYSINKKNLV